VTQRILIGAAEVIVGLLWIANRRKLAARRGEMMGTSGQFLFAAVGIAFVLAGILRLAGIFPSSR
jgi:hypothetical protein